MTLVWNCLYVKFGSVDYNVYVYMHMCVHEDQMSVSDVAPQEPPTLYIEVGISPIGMSCLPGKLQGLSFFLLFFFNTFY